MKYVLRLMVPVLDLTVTVLVPIQPDRTVQYELVWYSVQISIQLYLQVYDV